MIVFLGVLGLLVWLAEKYSMDHVLDGLDFATALDKTVVEPGEDFSWTMTINNRKRLMVPYLQMREQIPAGLVFSENGENVAAKSSGDHLSVLYLKGRQKTELERRVLLKKRGRYFFRGVSAEAGDFLGLQTALETYPELKEIVVKPAPSGWEELPRLLGGYAGEYVVKRSLFEDPVLIRGFREYTGREPLRSISWVQSARQSRFLVKEQENMTDLSCTILLDVECRDEEREAELLEQCFSMVRSICEELEKQRIAYDFQTNGVIAGAMGNLEPDRRGPGAGPFGDCAGGAGKDDLRLPDGERGIPFRHPEGAPVWKKPDLCGSGPEPGRGAVPFVPGRAVRPEAAGALWGGCVENGHTGF